MKKFFKLEEHGTNVKTEIVAGITTFMAMAYILMVNAGMFANPFGDGTNVLGVSYGAIYVATAISAVIGTLLIGLLSNLPLAQASGMGLNAFFAYTVVLGMGYTYGQALVIVFLSGIFFIVITAIGLREAIIRSIPDAVKMAITPGIGLFITIIGLKNAGIIISNPATLVSLVDFSQWKLEGADMMLINGALTALIGLIIMGILHARKVKGSILLGIVAATLIGIPLGITHLSNLDMNIGVKFTDFAADSSMRMDFTGLFAGTNFMETVFTVTMLVISFS